MKVDCILGDITKIRVDVIVNAANNALRGGGGVDGAIHRAGGPEILEACKQIKGGCPTGKAVITTAGKLPAKAVIHTVGPVWKGGTNNEAELLRSCYLESLQLAEGNNLQSLAFPNISTGVYGYPKLQAAEIAVDAVRSYSTGTVKNVIFVCYDQENFELYSNLLART